jgi:hypothetical protein
MSNVSTNAALTTTTAGGPTIHEDCATEKSAARAPLQSAIYYDTSGAARRLGVSPRTLSDYRSRGGGPKWVRIARAVRYRADWLDQWADDKAVTSTSQETAHARR